MADVMESEREFLEWAMDTLHEINVSNYDHDDVCRLNERSVEVILAIRARLSQAGAGGGVRDIRISFSEAEYGVGNAVNHHPDSEPSETELAKLRRAISAYIEAAKPKEGLKLGSRLTVEGVEAVVVPAEASPAQQSAALRYVMRQYQTREVYRAMLSAAGDGE